MALIDGRDIASEQLPLPIRQTLDGDEPGGVGADDPEYARLVELLRQNQGNISAVARAMNTSRSHVRRLVKRYRLDLESFRL